MGAFFTPSEQQGVKRAERSAATLIPCCSDGTLCAAIAEQISAVANSPQSTMLSFFSQSGWVHFKLPKWVKSTLALTFRPFFEQQFVQVKENQMMLGIEFKQRLVGLVQLAKIDHRMRRAVLGIGIGEKNLRGHGIGKTALCIVLDYAFTVKGLERIYAEVFSFNQHSQKLMERVGFQREGLLRQHDLHNGVRQDTYIFGILKPEFYQKYETIFKLGLSSNVDETQNSPTI